MAGSPQYVPKSPAPLPRDQRYALDHIVVQFKPGVDKQSAERIVNQFGATLGDFIQTGSTGIYKVKTAADIQVEDLVIKLKGNTLVEIAEFDGFMDLL